MGNVAMVGSSVIGNGGGIFTLSSGSVPIGYVGALISAGGNSSFSYENQPFFKNRVRESRGFGVYVSPSSASGTPVVLTAAGWPAADFGCLLYEGGTPLASWATATLGAPFKCGFIGTGSESVSALLSGTVANVVHGSGGAYTTFDYYGGTGDFGFNVTGTTGGVTNVFAYLPEYPGSTIDDPTTAAAFTTEVINHWSQFAFLDLEWPTNAWYNTQLCTAANRHTPSNTQTSTQCINHWGNGTTTWTGAPSSGATSATLSTWALGPGTWCLTFGTTYESRFCTVGSGTTNVAVTWSPGLTSNESTAVYTAGTEGYPIEWWLALAVAANTGIKIPLPIYEDGTNGAPGTYTQAVMTLVSNTIAANPSWTGYVLFDRGNENWNSTGSTFRVVQQAYNQYGYANAQQYIAYLLHTAAGMGRSTFGSLWGTRIRQVMAMQATAQVGQFYNALSYMTGQGWTPSSDVYYGAIAPYGNPTTSGSDSVATIEAAMATAAPSAAFSSKTENGVIMCLHYGLQTMTYESNWGWSGSGYSGLTNLGAALNDVGYVAPSEAYLQALFDSGIQLLAHSTAGISAGSGTNMGGGNGGLEFNYIYGSPITSSMLTALQSFFSGFTPTRNVINGSGSVISGGNYADKVGAANPSFPSGTFTGTNGSPYYSAQGYIGWFFNCTKPGTYSLVIAASGSGTPTTSVEIGSSSGFTIPYTGVSLASGNTTVGNVTLVQGPGYILLGNGTPQSTLTISSLTFN